jgi:hypothetical protein
MVAEHVATELADRAAFLRDHRQCLAANIPRQRSDDA